MFRLPVGYQVRWPVDYYPASSDAHRLQTWQAAVYSEARRAMEATGARRLIDIGCGSGEKAMHYSSGRCIGLEFGDNVQRCTANFPQGDWRAFNVDEDDALPVTETDLSDAVLVSADVIEHLEHPGRLLRVLLKSLELAPVAILSTPDRALLTGAGDLGPPLNPVHVREWTSLEMRDFLQDCGLEHGVITWTPSDDLALSASSLTIFLSQSPEVLDRLDLLDAPVTGIVIAPPRPPRVSRRVTSSTLAMRRQVRRAQLRFLGRRRVGTGARRNARATD